MMASLFSVQRPAEFLNPTYQIPPEILTHVFCYACRSEGCRTKRTGFLATVPTKYGKAIVALTHVCRYWRAILLANSKFWTTANLTHPFMTTALLERSGSRPIIASYITPNMNALVPSANTLSPHFSRIQKIHISASMEQLMVFLSSLSGFPSILEAVELECRSAYGQGDEEEDEDYSETWEEGIWLPSLFEDVPNLKFLRLSNLSFSTSFTDLHQLTHLELCYTTASSDDYVDILISNPMLKVVILRGVGYSEWGDTDLTESPILLPHLRRLELYDAPIDPILWKLIFLPGTHLSYVCTNKDIVVPRSNDVLNIATAEKLHYRLSKRQGRFSRVAAGLGPKGTFLLCDVCRHLGLGMFNSFPRSLKELSIAFAGTEAGEGGPSLAFVDTHGFDLQMPFSTFTCLRTLILRRVDGCEVILRLLSDPRLCPKLNTVILADVRSCTTYWPALVGMARARNNHPGSSNLILVDISCHVEDSPEPDQLLELRAQVSSVKLRSWNCGIEELDWLNDPAFRNLQRL